MSATNPMIDCDGLHCPECGGVHLHQRKVRVWFRDREDSPTGRHVIICSEGMASSADMSKNTSRRDNLHIEFECEECEMSQLLEIVQHEGQTYVQWITR